MPEFFSDTLLPAGTRLACVVEYDGSGFNGWQVQPHPGVVTVQQTLEEGLSRVAAAPVRVHCAGRTDSGVHACGQVIHFDAPATRSPKSWVMGGNANLPPSIRLHAALPVPDSFHARFSALARRYLYCVVSHPVRPATVAGKVAWVRHPLDAGAMAGAAAALLGEQDFSAFRGAGCQSRSRNRNVHRVQVYRRGALLVIDITANAFLLHMVRNIAGSLLEIGRGRRPVDWIAQLLSARDRSRAAETAPAEGLYLLEVSYPAQYGIPAAPLHPLLMEERPLPAKDGGGKHS